MKDFSGKIAVITGGGTGMGRELARQLVAEGCSVAMCDLSEANMAETARLCRQEAAQGAKVTTHMADVSIEDQILTSSATRWRSDQETDKIHLLFNNAGIGGGGSFVDRAAQRVGEDLQRLLGRGLLRLPRLPADADEGRRRPHRQHLVSVNGFWASLGPQTAHTAYSAAKFAVKGFTEALINDLQAQRAAHQVLGGDARPHRHRHRHQLAQGARPARGRPSSRAEALAGRAAADDADGRRRLGQLTDDADPGDGRRAGPRVPRQRPDQRRPGRQDHPRRGEGRRLAHPGRRRRPPHGRTWSAPTRSTPTSPASSSA